MAEREREVKIVRPKQEIKIVQVVRAKQELKIVIEGPKYIEIRRRRISGESWSQSVNHLYFRENPTYGQSVSRNSSATNFIVFRTLYNCGAFFQNDLWCTCRYCRYILFFSEWLLVLYMNMYSNSVACSCSFSEWFVLFFRMILILLHVQNDLWCIYIFIYIFSEWLVVLLQY